MKILESRRKQLEKFFWFIHHEGSFMQQAIAEQMERLGKTVEEKTITYRGRKIPGFFVDKEFSVLEWLVDNRSSLERFDAYHSDFSEGPWEKWRKEIKTSTERRKSENVARQLRIKDGLGKRPAGTFKMRRKPSTS